MIDGEARMEALSAQFREVKVAHDELVDHKVSLQVRCHCPATQASP